MIPTSNEHEKTNKPNTSASSGKTPIPVRRVPTHKLVGQDDFDYIASYGGGIQRRDGYNDPDGA